MTQKGRNSGLRRARRRVDHLRNVVQRVEGLEGKAGSQTFCLLLDPQAVLPHQQDIAVVCVHSGSVRHPFYHLFVAFFVTF